jgi:hypothetical protein
MPACILDTDKARISRCALDALDAPPPSPQPPQIQVIPTPPRSRASPPYPQQCMTSYYRTKSPACLDEVLGQIRQMPANTRAEPSATVGFLAEIFRSSAPERERTLKSELADNAKSIVLNSLYRAGLPQEAQKFAAASNLAVPPENLRATRLIALDAVRPSSIPADNDLLIGAYMASGDTDVIRRILANYSSADDAMAGDGFRVGLMMSKFGPGLAPKGRNPVTVQAACAKYRCKEDQTGLLRMMTLGTAFWSLQSLSGQDEGIKKTLSDFIEGDPRLKGFFTAEQTAFGNYVAAIALVTAFADDHKEADRAQMYEQMDKSASIYENLGSPKDAFAPFTNLKK